MSQVCNTCGGELLQGVSSNRCPRCLVELGLLEESFEELQAGDWIDRYKLVEQIGEGGFGVVFLAEQWEPVRRQAALKIIKPGMDTRQVIARFEAERQALALMDHPNIAKVLDGGATESGRPYFVMELVHGVPITQYSDAHRLSTAERMRIFIQVCQAVQHAHQKGVIHRDLKPSNILVTVEELGSPGVPKVIDFGVAKATQMELTEKTVFTQHHQFIGTPAYMSPEQAELTSVDIDTRSDIYSLGVLLYELLTGRTPFDTKVLLQEGLDQMRQTLREQEPPRPSTKLKSLGHLELSITARHRQSEPPRLIHLLQGDLDWIVMKALEKERARRYQTANALAMDLQRHLNDEAVLARPPSRIYQLQKAIRRNRIAFTLGTAVIMALIIGFMVATVLYFRERREHERAERAESTKTEQLWQAYLATAQAKRHSGLTGQRFESLAAISNAAAIRVSTELRNEAIAALALTDLGPPQFGHNTPWVGDHSEELPEAFDSDLRRVALLADDGSIHLFRVEDHAELLQILPDSAPPRERALILAFSPDDHMLAARYDSGVIRCWQLEPLRLRFETKLEPALWYTFGFSGDSEWLVGGTSNQLWAFDLRRPFPTQKPGSTRVQPDAILELSANPGELAFDNSSKSLAIVVGDTEIQIWKWPERERVSRFTETQGVPHLLWHPDSRHLIAGTSDGPIHLWDTTSGTYRTLAGHRNWIQALALHPRGNVLASESWDGTTKLWDINDETPMLSTEEGNAKRFSRDGRVLGFRHTAHRYGTWPIAVSRVFRRLASPHRWTGSVDFHPSGRLLVWTDDFGLGWLDLGSGAYSVYAMPGLKGARFNDDGTSLLVDSDEGLKQWRLHEEDIGQSRLKLAPELDLVGTNQIPLGYWHWSHQNRDAVLRAEQWSGWRNHRILIRAPKAAERMLESPSRAAIMGLSLSPDGRWLALSHHKGPTFVLDANTGATVKEWLEVKTACVSFTPDGRWLITGNGQRYQFWETGTWQAGRSIERGKASSIGALMSFSGDGRLLACIKSLGTVELLDWRTGEVIGDLISPRPQGIIDLAFSPDNSALAVIADGALELWDLRELRKELARLKLDWDQPPYSTSTNSIGDLVFRRASEAETSSPAR